MLVEERSRQKDYTEDFKISCLGFFFVQGKGEISLTEKQRGRSYYYHVGKKKFELAELKLLVDAIQSSKFITVKKSHELIRKLESFFSYIMRALSSSLTVIYEGTGI